MKTLTEIQKLILTIVIVISILGTVTYFTYDAIEKIKVVKADIVSKKSSLADVKSKVSKIPHLRSDIAELESHIDEMERTLPNGKEVELMLRQMQQLLTKTGIIIESITPSIQRAAKRSRRGKAKKGAGQGFYNRHQFTLSLQGQYHQLMRFISGIENMKRFTSIEDLSITGKDNELKIKMTIVTYEFKK